MREYTKEQILTFSRFMNNLERVKKEDYFLFKLPRINDRWFSELEVFEFCERRNFDVTIFNV